MLLNLFKPQSVGVVGGKMKGVQNIDERRAFAIEMTTIGVPLSLQRVGGTLTLNMNGTPTTSATVNQTIFEMDVSDIVDDTSLSQDFIGGRYAASGSGTGVIIINVGISDGVLTLKAKTSITSASILAFQAVVLI